MTQFASALAVIASFVCLETQPPHSLLAVAEPTKKAAAKEGDAGKFEIQKSTTARQARGVEPSKIEATKTEAALRLFVVDKQKEPIEGIVICLVSPGGAKFYTAATDAKGYAETLVPVGQTYEVAYLSLGRRDVSARVTVPNKANYTLKLTMQYSYRETRGVAGLDLRKVVLEGVVFQTGKATLTRSSFARMDRLVEYMEHKTLARIEISGHTDNVGNARHNTKLSERRAIACRDYLVSKGIQRSRITTVGYGDKRPVASNAAEDGRGQNRRIEVREL